MIPFLITIDTEGDNLWNKPKVIETKNARGLERFQHLCNEFGFKPVYLTNYEMVMDDWYVNFAKEHANKGECEIGMHLHPWNSPPLTSLTENDMEYQPFLMEYPFEVIREKVITMTKLLEDRFERKIYSHRAGRWGMSEAYYGVLEECGYHTDCTVTPFVDWSHVMGNPHGNGGSDYSSFPNYSYFPDKTDISKSGNGRVLEVPMTIVQSPRSIIFAGIKNKTNLLPRMIKRALFKKLWLRPDGHNLEEMLSIIQDNKESDYFEFMIHSSELSAGLNPTFPTEESIDNLYSNMKTLFSKVSTKCVGMTLDEYYQVKSK